MKTIFMSKEKADKWLHDLRSGEYKQGFLRLKWEDNYCCLGVLQMGIDGCVENMEDNGGFLSIEPSLQWLRKNNIEFKNRRNHPCQDPWLPVLKKSAASANDNCISFAEIANAIEECIQYTEE